MDQIEIGKYIAEKRQSKDMTQKSLAEQLLVSDKAVSKWERGICMPNVELLLPLSEILGVSIKEILSASDDCNTLQTDSLQNDTVVAGAVQLYGKETRKKERCKAFITSSIIIVLAFVIGVLPLYAKYSSSRYSEQAQDAWASSSTSVIELLDLVCEIKEDGYLIDAVSSRNLDFTVNSSIEDLLKFTDETKDGETVNTLSKEAEKIIHDSLGTIELNVNIAFSNGVEKYHCSESEIQQIRQLMEVLPQIHDNINEEMGVRSPGISQLYNNR
ncbi:MAG: helix-turn-helix domain-containing protein [Firmicutes bacterium]|nr:helix-turn-helix domain-containing protein [Bacillota bacterium]